MNENGRICNKCKIFKSWSMFHKNSSRPNGFMEVCKDCKNQIDRERRKIKKDEQSSPNVSDFNINNTLTISQLAERWGVNLKTMRNNVYRGKCPNYYKLGGGIKFDLDDVRKYEKERYIEINKNFD
jgi:hypothetical protein